LKAVIKRIPVLNSIAKYIYFTFVEPRSKFKGSELYWRKRYDAGLDSGEGSYLQLAQFNAKVRNDFVLEHGIKSVLELGCGDGNQLTLANYPRYLGVDVSPNALERCRERFPGDDSKQFQLLDSEICPAELGLSLDVIFHLVEDTVFEAHLSRLFESATRFVIIYSSNTDEQATLQGSHVRHWKFTTWIDQELSGWIQVNHIPNEFPYNGDERISSFSDLYIFPRKTNIQVCSPW
jgi:SAM-dependent methyltransferase